MAVIHSAGSGAVDSLGLGDTFTNILDWARGAIANDLWKWFDENPNRKIVTLNKWIFSFTVRCRHLEPLFELLLGPRPRID